MLAACCVLVKITRGYSINRIDDVIVANDYEPKVAPNNEQEWQQLQLQKPDRKQSKESLAEDSPNANKDAKEAISNSKNAGLVEPLQASDIQKITFYDNVIVHFDLKGAPPKVGFLIDVFRLIRKNGATGIMVEWEDTFPWSGVLEENRATHAYSMEEVKQILEAARQLGLDIIPLVQTFGHLEWILKLEKFRKHRENDRYPQVVCLADDEGVALVKEALKQVIDVHKQFGIKFFHIGADEAFQFGVCEKDREYFKSHQGHGKEMLATVHLKKIAEYVLSLTPDTKILVWHDMVKSFPQTVLKETGLSSLVEPVVWDYSETIQQQNEFTWQQLANSFQTVWGSSAFKGANYPAAQEINLVHYMRNNQGWLKHKDQFGKHFTTFRGLIMTGWSRYDHFAVLAELWVSGVPSLVLNLQVAHEGLRGVENNIAKRTSEALECKRTITLEQASSVSNCHFPGYEAFVLINRDIPALASRFDTEVYSNHQVRGWLGRFNMRHNYTQLWYFDSIQSAINPYYQFVLNTEKQLREAMSPIYSENTIEEWIYEYLDPTTEKIKKYVDELKRLSEVRVFPLRSFDIARTAKTS